MNILSNLARDFNMDRWWKLYSKAQETTNKLLKLYYTFRYMRMASKNGGYCGRETQIAGKPEMPHGFHGIHISRRASIGKDVTILQNVTIGNINGGGATIGDDVFIGAGATIVGEIHIGNHVKIGAGTVVFEDVPDMTTVVGQRPRYIRRIEKEGCNDKTVT